MNQELQGKEGTDNLSLTPKNEEGIYTITKKDGGLYSVRADRRRYFFPHEWKAFAKTLKEDSIHYLFYLILLHTGARAMEALNLKAKNFDFERNTITFEVIKHRKAKKMFYATGKSRQFFISKNCLSKVEKYIRKNSIEPNQYLFLNNSELPSNYDALSNAEKKKYYQKKEIAYSQMLKRKIKKAGIADWKQFSLHNLRKTYGNWMRIYDIKLEELCYRMGHDMATYLAHYGSSLIFEPHEKVEISKILGEVK